jgi:VanZ family protein
MIRRIGVDALLSRKSLGRASLALIFGMCLACLWPFHAPRNTASWIAGGHGVAFGDHGVLLARRPLGPANQDPDGSGCTLDLWLEPDQADTRGAILSIYTPANPRLLTIEQYHDGLAVRSAEPGDPVRTGGAQLYTDRVFVRGKAVLVTITSGGNGSEVFVNGIFRSANPGFRICNKLFSGKLVAGAAAATDYRWGGRLTGLAVFSRTLSPREILEDYERSSSRNRPLFEERGLAALYLFEEGAGTRVRDKVSGNDLYMPDRYLVVADVFLSPPSLEDHLDIIANIIGFIPLGFTLCGYLTFYRRKGTGIVATIFICGIFSLLIESLQWFLPTRDSDMTDVITNTFGGATGALLYGIFRRIRGSLSFVG